MKRAQASDAPKGQTAAPVPPAPERTQRVSDEQVAEWAAGHDWITDESVHYCHGGCKYDATSLALDLRDARAESARWRSVADALAGALKLLREAFPEPWVCVVGPFNALERAWGAEAILPSRWAPFAGVELSGVGDSPLAAAQALIAAWNEATAPQVKMANEMSREAVGGEERALEDVAKWRECATALAGALRKVEWAGPRCMRCQECAGWNMSANGETDMVHTADCKLAAALARFAEMHKDLEP